MVKNKTYKINSQTHRLYRVENECQKGINSHRTWYCEINDICICSNDDILGDKFYIIDPKIGFPQESSQTKWYATPTAAAIAYFQLKDKAIYK